MRWLVMIKKSVVKSGFSFVERAWSTQLTYKWMGQNKQLILVTGFLGPQWHRPVCVLEWNKRGYYHNWLHQSVLLVHNRHTADDVTRSCVRSSADASSFCRHSHKQARVLRPVATVCVNPRCQTPACGETPSAFGVFTFCFVSPDRTTENVPLERPITLESPSKTLKIRLLKFHLLIFVHA